MKHSFFRTLIAILLLSSLVACSTEHQDVYLPEYQVFKMKDSDGGYHYIDRQREKLLDIGWVTSSYQTVTGYYLLENGDCIVSVDDNGKHKVEGRIKVLDNGDIRISRFHISSFNGVYHSDGEKARVKSQ